MDKPDYFRFVAFDPSFKLDITRFQCAKCYEVLDISSIDDVAIQQHFKEKHPNADVEEAI